MIYTKYKRNPNNNFYTPTNLVEDLLHELVGEFDTGTVIISIQLGKRKGEETRSATIKQMQVLICKDREKLTK